MSNLTPQHQPLAADIIEQVLVKGDLAKLTEAQRVSYYTTVCTSLGLNQLTKPFAYISLNGRLTLYALKDATDQLRKIHHISIQITSRERIDDLIVVTARARNHGGREDESTGVVNAHGLKGEALANAMMKAETKAKRRATLSLCGLGFLDETEIETIKDARPYNPDPKTQTAIDLAIRPVDRPAAPDKKPENYGDHVIRIGKKFLGQMIRDVNHQDLEAFIQWINLKADKAFQEHPETQEFMFYAENFLAEEFDKQPEASWDSDLDKALKAKLEDPRA